MDKCQGSRRETGHAVQRDLDADDQFVLKTDAVTLEPRHKPQTAITIRRVMKKRRDEGLHSLTEPGESDEVSKAKASAHFNSI